MKVRYCKLYTDEYGDTFEPGWVAEHTDAEAGRRIALGVCSEVSESARSLKLAEGAELVLECAEEPETEPVPLFGGAKPAVSGVKKVV
jgi:hypothetical protein